MNAEELAIKGFQDLQKLKNRKTLHILTYSENKIIYDNIDLTVFWFLLSQNKYIVAFLL